jgi:long-chain acyl-CoA synthetase
VIGFDELEALGAAAEGEGRPAIEAVLQRQTLADTALIIYTSGSTGKPKGAMISYGNVAAMAAGVVDRLGLVPSTSHLSYLPLCHVAEQMLTVFVPLYLGSRVDFGESIRTVQEDLREVAPTMFLGVPRIWEKLLAAISIRIQESGRWRRALYAWAVSACTPFAYKTPAERSLRERLVFGAAYLLVFRALQNYIGLRRCRVALTGAAPISAAVVQYFRTLGVPLLEVYGMTETSGMVLGQRPARLVPATVGVPTLGVEHRLSPEGELQVRGPVVFQGYYKNPEATAAALVDGWLHTGDVVEEKDGELRIVDRLKDIMITAGGKNLTPSEVENTMKASPFIKECVIVADARRFVAALVQIDFETAAQWAQSRGLVFTHFRSLAEHPELRALVQAEIDAGNRRLASVAQVRRFHLLTKELDHDDGEVTATMKVRRASVYKAYAREIEALYA